MKLALLLALLVPAASGAVTLTPRPGSDRLRPETGVIARFDRDLEPFAVGAGTIVARGAASGAHAGRVILSDDRRTVVFRPDRPFAPGERVDAAVRDPGTGELASFSFTIAAGPPLTGDPVRTADLPFAFARTAETDSVPDDLPHITSTVLGPTAPGRIFIAPFPAAVGAGTAYLLITDDAGTPLFRRRMPSACLDFKLQPNGLITFFDTARECFFAMDSTYATVDSFKCGNGYLTDVHELRFLPNGHVLLLASDYQHVDMSAVVPGGNPNAVVIGMILQELDAAKNVVFQWRSWDHFAITDAVGEDLTTDFIDYVHSNAIEIDADGNYLLSSRHMDEITKIDHVTGATIWRWGGKHNEFAFVDDPLGFSHQHAIRRIANGHYTLFDNGNGHPFKFSRAVEYELDQEAKTARLVWQFDNGPDTFGFAMGYVQRLPNGNTLVSYGTGDPDVIEVAPDGTRLLVLKLPAGMFSYRVTRSPWREEAGTPALPASFLSAAYPNPLTGSTRMTVHLARPTNVSVDVFDALGRRVSSHSYEHPQPTGTFPVDLDLSSLRAGMYFCRVSAGNESSMRKLVLLH